MIDFHDYVESYWKYYLSLEKRLMRTEEYVAFDDVNAKAYSVEYLSLLQIVCSEIDVTGRAIAKSYDSNIKKDANIMKWGYIIQQSINGITLQETEFINGESIIPWSKWELEERINKKGNPYIAYAEGNGSPKWWLAYTKVKHARTEVEEGDINYHLANQKNAITAFAALYILHRLYMIEMNPVGYSKIDHSKLFSIPNRDDEDPIVDIEVKQFFKSLGWK